MRIAQRIELRARLSRFDNVSASLRLDRGRVTRSRSRSISMALMGAWSPIRRCRGSAAMVILNRASKTVREAA